MASKRGTLAGLLITGLAIGAAVQANVDTIRNLYVDETRNNQAIIQGDMHFATNDTATPAITIDGADVIEISQAGDVTIKNDLNIDGALNSSGALRPIVYNLNEDNYGGDGPGDGSGSGWSVQNPYSEKLRCTSYALITTTAPTDGDTSVDVSRGTGALTVSGVASGVTLFDGYTFVAGIANSTGSLLQKTAGAILYPLNFILDEAGGDNDYFLITARGTGTGGGLDSDMHAECYSYR